MFAKYEISSGGLVQQWLSGSGHSASTQTETYEEVGQVQSVLLIGKTILWLHISFA